MKYCEFTDAINKIYTCTHVVEYKASQTDTEIYAMGFEYTIKMGDGTKEVTSVIINNSGLYGGDFSVPVTLTRWNKSFDTEITDPT